MNLKAKFDAVIVKPLEEQETTYGSIIVPELDKDRNIHGEVIAVILPAMGFTKLEHKGEEYFIGAENQILAEVIKEEE